MGFWRNTAEIMGLAAPAAETTTTSQASPSLMRAGEILPPSRSDVSVVSVDVALGLAAVYRSISIIVTSISQMDLGVWRNEREIATPALIKQPNVNDTVSAFVEETVFSLAAHGNAYWRIHRADPASPVQSITVLDPTTVSITTELNGRKKYWIGNTELRDWQVKHLKLMRRPGHDFGYGPIQLARDELRGAFELRRFADNWFNVSGVPSGLLTMEKEFNSVESAVIAEAWKAFLAEHGGTAVLPPGVKYEPIHVKPAEAQFLEVQNASVQSIARLYGIPARYLLVALDGSAMTYTNLETENIQFLQTTLARYMNEVENALTDLLPRGQVVRFREEQLLRLDAKTKWEIHKTQVEIAYTSGAELREAEGKRPLPTPPKESSNATE